VANAAAGCLGRGGHAPGFYAGACVYAATGDAPAGVFYVSAGGVVPVVATARAYCLGLMVHPAALTVAWYYAMGF